MGYVPSKLIVHGNAAATASNIAASETLFRLGIAAVLIGAAMWWITPFTPLESAAMSAVIVMMGFLGGLLPAFRAARLPIVTALREG